MLSGLSVRNVVLIEQLNLEFDGGLTALTGETGAGKSIILDSLGMATGARSDRGLLRTGAERAESTASFSLASGHPVMAVLDTHDIELSDGEDLTLRRVIRADGRSKAYINDAPVSVKDTKLAEERRFLQGAEGAVEELTAAQTAMGEGGEFEEKLSMVLAGIERVSAKFVETSTPLERNSLWIWMLLIVWRLILKKLNAPLKSPALPFKKRRLY